MKKEELIENSLRLLVSVIGIFIICIVLLIFKLNVDAATVSSGDLPYVVPEYRNSNSAIPDSAIETAISTFEQNKPSSVDSYLIFTNDGIINGLYYDIMFISNPSVDGSYIEDFNFLTNSVQVHSNDYQICRVLVNISNTAQIGGFNYNMGSYANLLGNSVTNNGITLRYPFYYVGEDIYSSNDVLIFTNTVPNIPDVFQTGHAVEPNYDSDSIIDSGLRPNILPSVPNYTTYNITTYQAPTIDTSSVENLLKSIWDVISYTGQYIVSNVGGFINNIWNNISLAFGYIGDLLSYLFNKVLNTIKQSVNNLFENFRDLFEPVLNSFANLINIFNTLYNLGLKDGSFDIPTLFGALFVPNQSDLALLVDTFVEFDYLQTASVSIKSMLLNIFSVLNDDAVYSIHIQGFSFHGVSVPEQEISFDWYLPYKATGDIFISAFLIVGYLYWLWTRLSGIFHGVAPDSVTTSKITSEVH